MTCRFGFREEAVREHARQGGFPANRISQVKSMIDPTGEAEPFRVFASWVLAL
jgi:hypothetical protein